MFGVISVFSLVTVYRKDLSGWKLRILPGRKWQNLFYVLIGYWYVLRSLFNQ